jgi:hypothetical protein
MSDTGKQSPLGVNVLASILQNIGLSINTVVQSYIGESKEYSSYTFGSLCSDTVLNKLTQSIRLAYNSGSITESTYNNLIKIGSTTIPALGNTPPETYTYIGNTNVGSPESINQSWLPWTKQNLPSTSTSTGKSGEATSYGYLRLFALQAWNEFNWNGLQTNTNIQYSDFLTSFITGTGFIENTNAAINSMANSIDYLDGIYSNMNDLITGEITGVNLATIEFGQDLISLGKALDLSKIDSFGLPSTLLRTVYQNNGMTQSLNLALLASGLNLNTVENIAKQSQSATTLQEQRIFGAFLIIQGVDLNEILVALNCKTKNLSSLADLLNLKKLFPNSYRSMTVPIYNTTTLPTNSKTYYLIYDGDSINSRLTNTDIVNQIGTLVTSNLPAPTDTDDILINDSMSTPLEPNQRVEFNSILNTSTTNRTNSLLNNQTEKIQPLPVGFDSYLVNIIPQDQAIAAGAFSMSMQQIKNITSIPIEKFAKIVGVLETTRNLNLINGTTVPVDKSLAEQGLSIMGVGSGPNGTYTYADLFGSMSGTSYYWKDIEKYIKLLETNTLKTIYQDLYDELNKPIPDNSQVETYITLANTEIANILASKPKESGTLNLLWNLTGTQLTVEQSARLKAINIVPSPRDNSLSQTPNIQISFVDSIPQYANETNPHMAAQTLEAIADWSTVGGQSIVGLMRESRNINRLSLIGVPVENNIDSNISVQQNNILESNGTLPNARNGVPIPGIGCVLEDTVVYTLPSNLEVLDESNNVQSPTPKGYYNPNDLQYYITETNIGGQGSVVNSDTSLGDLLTLSVSNSGTNILGPYCDGTGPDSNNTIGIVKGGSKIATGIGVPEDTGNPIEPGSLSGNPYQNLVPDNLNTLYSSGILTISTYPVEDALAKTIECNCDCWLQ